MLDGELVGATETEPNELRGTDLRGGRSVTLHPGDVAVVPAGTPHWFKAVVGDVEYFTVNVMESRPESDDAAIRKQMSAYEDGRKRGDVAAQVAVFAPDADMWFASTNEWESGARLRDGLAKTPDPNRSVDVERVTMLISDSAVVDARYSGGTNSGRGVYVFVKRDGRWLIRTSRIVRDYPAR